MWEGRRPTIWLRRDLPRWRIAFVLTHELAHIAVERLGRENEWFAALHDDGGSSLEGACNQAAGELLLPRDWILKQLSTDPTFPSLRAVAAAAGVSPLVAGIRLRDLGCPITYARWARGPEHCHLVHGIRPLSDKVRLADDGTLMAGGRSMRPEWGHHSRGNERRITYAAGEAAQAIADWLSNP